MKKLFFVVVVCVGTMLNAHTQNTLYVNAGIEASGSGTSWLTAYKTLSEALDFANQPANANITNINVAAGTYLPTNQYGGTARDATFAIMRSNLKIYGGFNAADGTRNFTNNPTILSGNIGDINSADDNNYHVMLIAGVDFQTDSLVVDGFTITGGKADGDDILFINERYPYQGNGAGIYSFQNTGDKIALRNCIISGNMAVNSGGGMSNENSSPLILTNVTISGNSAGMGGGIYNIDTAPILNNVTISGNTASYGGGMYNMGSSPILINLTISGNTADIDGGGIVNNFLSNPKIRNTIVYGNNSGIFNGIMSNPDIAYSLVQEMGGDENNNNLDGIIDPLFINQQVAGLSTAGDYRLKLEVLLLIRVTMLIYPQASLPIWPETHAYITA